MTDNWRPRLVVDVEQTQLEELRRLIPHGMRAPIFGALVQDLIDLLNKMKPTSRVRLYGLIAQGEVQFSEILASMRQMREADDGHNR